MAIIYAITLSDLNISRIKKGGHINDLDLVWFVSYNKHLTEKVIDYFENADYKYFEDILNTIMLVDDSTKLSRPLFKIISSYVSEYNDIIQRIAPVIDMILPEGIANRYSTKIEQQYNHRTYFNIEQLNKIKNDFDNDDII